MKKRVFEVRGVLVDADGEPISGMVLAIADEDLHVDDLIGVGVANDDGSFRLAFTREAFNQDLFENEPLPDLYIVVSTRVDGKLRAIHRQGYPHLWFDAEEDLGQLQVPWRPDETPKPLVDQEALPALKKRARRLNVDDAAVSYALAEVAPLVEAATGWPGLLEGTEFDVMPKPSDGWSRVIGTVSPTGMNAIARFVYDTRGGIMGSMAMVDPFAKTIYVFESTAKSQNIDFLKVILGHELVHAGQFRHHPGLVDEYRAWLEKLTNANLELQQAVRRHGLVAETTKLCQQRVREASAQGFGLMANIEGHASAIEKNVLRKVYNCTLALPHMSLWQSVVKGVADAASDDAGEAAKMLGVAEKMGHYSKGRQAYETRDGDQAAGYRFDPELRVAQDTE